MHVQSYEQQSDPLQVQALIQIDHNYIATEHVHHGNARHGDAPFSNGVQALTVSKPAWFCARCVRASVTLIAWVEMAWLYADAFCASRLWRICAMCVCVCVSEREREAICVCIQTQRYKSSLISHSAGVRQHNRSQIRLDNLSHEQTTMPEALATKSTHTHTYAGIRVVYTSAHTYALCFQFRLRVICCFSVFFILSKWYYIKHNVKYTGLLPIFCIRECIKYHAHFILGF